MRKPIKKHSKCMTCEHFVWWDGDFCCLKHMKIMISGDTITDEDEKELKRYNQCKDYLKRIVFADYIDMFTDGDKPDGFYDKTQLTN